MIAPLHPRRGVSPPMATPPMATLGAEPEDAPWVFDPLVWLPRLVHLRLGGMVPVIGLLLWEVQHGIVQSATGLFGVIAGFAVINVVAFVIGRKVGSRSGARVTLAVSLGLDVLFLVWIAHLGSGLAGPTTAFLVLPVLLASLTLPERGGVVIAVIAAVTLLLFAFLAGSDPAARGAAAAVSMLLIPISVGVGWYRRRSRYLERRVQLLEDRARSSLSPRRVSASPMPGSRIPALADGDPAGTTAPASAAPGAAKKTANRRLEVVARSLAAELLEPAGMVRARAENLRYELEDHEHVAHLLADVDRMLWAADRLDDVRLTLSALAGDRTTSAASADVRSVAREVKDALVSGFERDGVRLRMEAPRGLPLVHASHNEVRLTVARLLQVARLAASAQARTIRLSARFAAADRGVVLSVDDPLPPPDLTGDLFDPARELKRRPSLCVALATVRSVVESRSGTVSLEPSPRGGLRIKVWWPAASGGDGSPRETPPRKKRGRRRASRTDAPQDSSSTDRAVEDTGVDRAGAEGAARDRTGPARADSDHGSASPANVAFARPEDRE